MIDWQREFSGSLLVFNLALKLADLGYHDHTEETTVESNVSNCLLQETFSVLATGT